MKRLFALGVRTGACLAIAGAAIAVANRRYLDRQAEAAEPATMGVGGFATVSVLVPMRNESENATAFFDAIRDVQGISEILVLDDDSDDDTGQLISQAAQRDARIRVVQNTERRIPPNWLGKNWALVRLSKEAESDYLAFVDADVRLGRDAVTFALAVARNGNFDMVSPYPRQTTNTTLSRLIQPLLQWSWMSTVPLALSDQIQHRSMAVGAGQFMVIRRDVYESVGGHAAVANSVIEDVGLARLLRTCGHRTTVANGAHVADCHMYNTDEQLIEGYTKNLAIGLGGARSAMAAVAGLKLAYVVPPLALVVSRGPTRWWGLAGYGAALVSRAIVAQTTGQRMLPDILAHPASISALALLTTRSVQLTRAGQLTWRGRLLNTQDQSSGEVAP